MKNIDKPRSSTPGAQIKKPKLAKSTKIVLFAVLIFVLVGLAFMVMNSMPTGFSPSATTMQSPQNSNQQNAPAGEPADQVGDGAYEQYDSSKLAKADTSSVVLFFNAKWCPSCQQANKSFLNNKVPDGLLILSVDYDTNDELKKKYGVTYQHTFVQVDANGNMIKKWASSLDATTVNEQVKR